VPAPRINGVVETCLYSDDLPRSVRFYQEQLGLRLLESSERLMEARQESAVSHLTVARLIEERS
jgi:catechol 2,3-dioxygenase-like lactoylglutathione lyase family enzyme